MQEILTYRIADFPVKMNCRSMYTKHLFESYQISEYVEEAWDLCYDEKTRAAHRAGTSPLAQFEYLYTMQRFVSHLVGQEAFCFHASALAVDGDGILFSADSGTGKSTHARLWKRFLEGHEIIHLNDDKPVIRCQNGELWAYGTPWCGKHSLHTNGRAKIKALIFLEQAQENVMERVPMEQAFFLVFPQVIGGRASREEVASLVGLLDVLIKHVPVYRLKCNISEEAVRLAYDVIYPKESGMLEKEET